MFPIRTTFFAFCAALLLAATAIGATDGVGVVKYSFATLDSYWQTQVTARTPQTLTKDVFQTTLSAAPPMSSPTSTSPRSGRGICPPSQCPPPPPPDAGAPAAPVSIYFEWIVPASGLDADMLSRQLTLSMFVNKTGYYQADTVQVGAGTSMDDITKAKAASDAQTNLLALRTYSARVELFLIGLMRYYAVETVPEKCERVKELQQLMQQISNSELMVNSILKLGPPLALEQRFVDLRSIYSGLNLRFSGEIAQAKACLVAPASTHDEDLAAAATKLDTMLKADLTARSDGSDAGAITLQDTIDSINTSQKEIHGLKDSLVTLNPMANELLQLKMDLQNAQSNFDMVRLDQLGAQQASQNMDKNVDPSKITGLSSVLLQDGGVPRTYPPLDSLAAANATLTASLTAYLTALQGAADTVPAVLQPNNELAVCRTINPAALLDLTKAAVDVTPVTSCLSALRVVVTNAGAQTTFQQEMGAVATSVQKLSSLVLCQRQGTALNNCPN